MINPNEGNQVTWDKAFMGQPGLSKEYTTEWPVIQVKPLTSGTYNIVPQNGIICEAFNIYNVELECSFGNFYLNLSNTTTYNITFNVSGRVVVPTSGTTIEIYINTVCSC